MAVVKLDPEEMKALDGRLSADPAVAKLYALLKAEAERRGGKTLAVWKLHMGKLWGVPVVMTSDEVAKRLRMPVSTVAKHINSVTDAVRNDWKATREYQASDFAKGD